MNRTNLIVSGDLACPPSEIYVFRSFTFFARRMCDYDVLVAVPWEYRDTYWNWFKDHSLMDDITDFIDGTKEDVAAIKLSVSRLTCENLHSSLRQIGFNFKKFGEDV